MYGERLKRLRKERGLTIDEVSEKLDLARSTYAGYETENRKPPIENIIKFAEFHDTSVDYILGLTDNRQSKKNDTEFSLYLKNENLTWNGVPLSEEELKPIKDILEIVVRDRLPYKKKIKNNIK